MAWRDIFWWASAALAGYLTLVALYLTLFPNSAPAMALQFLWCTMTHQRWFIVQKEAETLTRLYCTRCGHTHLAFKRQKDRGKPRAIPDDPPRATRKGEPSNGNASDRNGKT